MVKTHQKPKKKTWLLLLTIFIYFRDENSINHHPIPLEPPEGALGRGVSRALSQWHTKEMAIEWYKVGPTLYGLIYS